jgi:hypothetical protein
MEIIEFLKKVIEDGCWEYEDGDTVDDFAGGNVDDAFYGGVACGRVDLAKEILAKLEEA